MDSAALLLTALLLGGAHALEPDHVAAVSSFTVRRPHARAAFGYGTRWALGHGAVVVLAGAAFSLLGFVVPAAPTGWLERLVGVSLIALGSWTIAGRRQLHAHRHAHANALPHTHPHAPAHGHSLTAIGALHGLAGAAPVLALVPMAGADSTALTLAFLVLFALGTAAGMTLFAVLAGWLAHRAAGRSLKIARALSIAAGAATIGIGLLWLVR